MIRVRYLVGCLLACIVVADGVLTFRVWRARADLERRNWAAVLREGVPEVGGDVLGHGLAADGSLFAALGPETPVVVRYAAQSCGYCRADVVWPQLAEELRLRGARVVVLVPRLNERFDDGELYPAWADQVVLVSMEWMKHFRLTATPTAMLFDGRGGLVWAQEGMLGPDSIRTAVRALKRSETGTFGR